ncbi:MAG TPA: hypothetical protein VFP68_10245, partial [Burkholderiaceae bacterium]|nr:hypothetical protein [Burkholderiaceae bacterium]
RQSSTLPVSGWRGGSSGRLDWSSSLIAFDVAGAGNMAMAAGLRAVVKAMEYPSEPNVGAPVLDPTCERLEVRLPRPTHQSGANTAAVQGLIDDSGASIELRQS